MEARLASKSVLPGVGLIVFVVSTMLLGRPVRAINSLAASEAVPLFSVFTVTNIGDSGVGSLRQAILDANLSSGSDLIQFNISGAGVHKITVLSALPDITDPVTIDGTTQPSGTIELDGSSAGAGANGLSIGTGSCVIRGLAIDGFSGNGIRLDAGGGHLIEGNLIGVGAGNGGSGIFVNSNNNTIGGFTAAARNVVSGNGGPGIHLLSASSNNVIGNFIGTDPTGTVSIGNVDGIRLDGSNNNTIGGLVPAARNVISGNIQNGILLLMGASGNHIQGNFIGTRADGVSQLGNIAAGIRLDAGLPQNNMIGGSSPGAGNVIAFNMIGVTVLSGTGNTIIGNSISKNDTLGIDLNNDSVSPNDFCDTDGGANGTQNFPLIDEVQTGGGMVFIKGGLNSTPLTQFRLDFYANAACSALGFGEGERFIGTATVTTDSMCVAQIDVTLSASVAAGDVVTATATDPSGNTSEFSICLIVQPAPCVIVCAPNKTASAPINQCGAKIDYSLPLAFGTCGTVSCTPPPGSLFPLGNTVVTCNSSAGGSCSFTVAVVDSTPPTILCPGDIVTGVASGQQTRVVNFPTPRATDNCSQVEVTCLPPSGAQFPLGMTTVTCRGRDDSNNEGSCSFVIRVSDLQPPTIQCPSNVNVVAPPNQQLVVVTYAAPTVSDNLPGTTVTCVPPSGSQFPVGTTAVTCTAEDASGNRSACSFQVVITGGPPSIRVIIPGDKLTVEFPVQKIKRKKKPRNLLCQPFSLANDAKSPAALKLKSIERTGPDISAISNRDDSALFLLTLVNSDQSQTSIGIGDTFTVAPGGQSSFCLRFNPQVPPVVGQTTGLRSIDVIPDRLESVLRFEDQSGTAVLVPVVGHVATAVIFTNPDLPARAPVFSFEKSGNSFFVTHSNYDANLDTRTARYDFMSSDGRVVASIDVDLAGPLSQSKVVRGEAFTIRQEFTGAADHPEVGSVQLSVQDGETTISQQISLGTVASASVNQLIASPRSAKLSLRATRISP